MVIKLFSQENTQRTTKKKFKKTNTEPKMVPKMQFRTIFGLMKNLFWFSFLESFQEV